MIVSIEEEESKVRNELGEIILKGEKEHGPLEARLAMLKEEYKVLTNLELQLVNVMEKGNIITYEKGSQAKKSRSSQTIRIIHIERNQKAAQIVQSLFSPCKKVQC